jgi:hypothetical protein
LYAIITYYTRPFYNNKIRDQRLELYELPDYKSRKNKSNDYGFDPHEQATATYTGMGTDINVHDQWAVESMGAVQDRTEEHLGVADKAITAYRRMLLQAIRDHGDGKQTPARARDERSAQALRGPVAVDTVAPADGWREHWTERDARRRDESPWAAEQVRR